MKRLILLALGLSFVAAACPTKPADYATELASCLGEASSWEEYTPCCVDVAHKYGRDPSFCFRGAEGLDAASYDGGRE